MEDSTKKTLITITTISLTLCGIGGITLLNIPLTKNIYNEAEKEPTVKEKSASADLQSKSKGEEALTEGNYLVALQLFLGIPDNSETVPNKKELVGKATDLYLSKTLFDVDKELECDNFDNAKNLINEGLKVIAENKELLNKLTYVKLREELYSLMQTETTENIIKFITNHVDVFENDKVVSEILGKAKATYRDTIISESDIQSNNYEYNVARDLIDSAKELIGSDPKFDEAIININKKETKHKISTYSDNEDWLGMYQYIISLEDTLKNDNLNSLKTARDKLINNAIADSNKYLEKKEYESANFVLSDMLQYIGEDKKINEQFEIINNTIIKNEIIDMTENSSWRELIDYFNASPSLIDDYKNDYSNAFTQYKASILKETQDCLDAEDIQSALEILTSAQDILGDDDEYCNLYAECNAKSQNV